MDTQRYSDTEWKTMVAAILREAARREDWQGVAKATALLERGVLDSSGTQTLLHGLVARQLEEDWQAMEEAFDQWLVMSKRSIGAEPLQALVKDAWMDEYENADGEAAYGACLYENEPHSGLLLTWSDAWEYLEDHAMWDARGTMWEGHGAAREYPVDAFYDAMRCVCQELFTDRILARERKNNPALLRA